MGVLIAGGTGALGTAVVRELLDAGYDCNVTWIVDVEVERGRQEFGDRARFIRADLFDPAATEEAVAAVSDLEAAELLGRVAVLDRADGSADERDQPPDVAARHSLRDVLRQAQVERVVPAV